MSTVLVIVKTPIHDNRNRDSDLSRMVPARMQAKAIVLVVAIVAVMEYVTISKLQQVTQQVL